MKEYKPLQIKKFSKKSFKHNEARRFKRFKVDKSETLSFPCNEIKICEDNSSVVTLFSFDTIYHHDLMNEKVISKYPHSKSEISTGTVRRDGRLIIAGYVDGKINVYEASKRLNLRSYYHHKLAVNSIHMAENNVNFITSSNDLSVKIFDLSATEPIYKLNKCHTDYVRCAKFIDENLIITGGYDKVVKIWDIRSKNNCVKQYDNININQDILIMKSKDRFITSAENLINVFDIRSDNIVQQANPIQNSIHKLITDKNQTRLFVVSQKETFVKVLDPITLSNLYSVNLTKEISTFDISADMNRYVVGYMDGEVQFRSRNVEEEGDDIYKQQEDKDFEMLE